MQSTISAVRAIGAEQIRRILRLGALITLIATASLVALLWWLANNLSDWWWVFLVPLIIIITILTIVGTVFWAITYLLMPRDLTRPERKQIHGFIDRLTVVAASMQVSRFALAVMIIRDALAGHTFNTRIQSIVGEGRDLKDDFQAIVKLF